MSSPLNKIEKSLTAKISLAVIAVLVFFISVLTAIDVDNETRDILNTYRRNASVLASTIEKSFVSAMKEGRSGEVQGVLEEVATQKGITGVRIFDEKGVILRSNNKAEIGRSVDSKTFQQFREAEGGEKTGREVSKVFSFVKPIHNQPLCFGCHPAGKKVNGILDVRVSMEKAYEEVNSNRWSMMKWAALTVMCVILAEIILLRFTVGKPVKRLRSAMLMAEKGEISRVEMSGKDELSELGRVFNGMMERISELGKEAVSREKEIVRSQEAVKSQTMLASVIQAMPDGVAILDRDMRLLLVNPSYIKFFPDVKVGDICYSRHKKDSPCPHCGVVGVFEDGKIHEHESTVTLPDGNIRIVHTISGPIMENGVITSAVKVLRDFTDRIMLERDLKEKTWELEDANKKLAQIAVTDGLTTLYNYRFFQDSLRKEFKRLARRKEPSFMSLAMMDVDDFKALNDTYGHLAGDHVLKGISLIMKDSVRITDMVARYGGEEFVVLMPETECRGAEIVAERLRKNIEDAEFVYDGRKIKVTVSIGLAGITQGVADDEEGLIKAADVALYKAKESGKNRVVLAKELFEADGKSSSS